MSRKVADVLWEMLGLGDLLTQVERKTRVVQIILNNESLDFVKIEQQEGGIIPFGVDFKNPDFAKVAEAMGAKLVSPPDFQSMNSRLLNSFSGIGGPS